MLLSKFQLRLDGGTSFERRRERWCNMVVLPFGEPVLYKQIRFESEDLEESGVGQNLDRNTTTEL